MILLGKKKLCNLTQFISIKSISENFQAFQKYFSIARKEKYSYFTIG